MSSLDDRIRRANRRWAEVLVDELAGAGLTHVVIAPGSRSTPLVYAAARHPAIETLVQLDERSAGFLALGIGKGSGRPAAVITTSGTAVANLLPAVVEAERSETPLLLLTADRPLRLRGVDANQAIRQEGIFGGFVRHMQELAPDPDGDPRRLRHLRSSAARAVSAALGDPAGPVHLNLAFEKPLEPDADGEERSGGADSSAEPQTGRTRIRARRALPEADEIEALAHDLAGARRPLLIAGRLPRSQETGPRIAELAHVLGVPLLADALSGARFAPGGGGFGGYDLALGAPGMPERLRPDCVIRFGASPTSAVLLEFLEGLRGLPITVVDGGAGWKDHQALATRMVFGDPARVARAVQESASELGRPLSGSAPGWLDAWREVEGQVEEAVAGALEEEPCEGSVLAAVVGGIPSDELLFVSSSMPIRDLDAFGLPGLRDAGSGALAVLGNRGASGIDGIVSTAIGAGVGSRRHVTAVVGDLALLHDVNGLIALRESGVRLTLVVVNNDGGGIFHLLPVRAHEPEFTRYFATPHGLEPARVAALHGLAHHRIELRSAPSRPGARPLAALRSALSEAWTGDESRILEVRTDRDENRTRRALVRARVHDVLAELPGLDGTESTSQNPKS